MSRLLRNITVKYCIELAFLLLLVMPILFRYSVDVHIPDIPISKDISRKLIGKCTQINVFPG